MGKIARYSGRGEFAKAIRDLTLVAHREAERSYTEGHECSEAHALGIAVAKHFGWDCAAIVETLTSALDEANAHTLSSEIEELAERSFGEA